MKNNLKFIISLVIFISIISSYYKVNATENNNPSEDGTTNTAAEQQSQNNPNIQVTENTEKNSENEQRNTETTETTTTERTETANSATQTTETKTNNQTQGTSTNKTQKKSSNANLKMLGINPNDFSGFKSGTTTYKVTVPNNVEQVNVYATPQDSKATISGTGNKKLNEGQNALSVTVKAEDGTEKKYTINVTREEKEKNNNNVENNKEENDLVKLEVEGYTLTPKFSPNTYEYKLNINKDVSDLKVITNGKDENVSIEVAGNTSLHEGENIITVLVTNNQTNNNATYQITVTKSGNEAKTDEKEVDMEPAMQKAKKIRYICIGLIILVIIGLVAFIILRRKKNVEDIIDDKYEYDMEDQEKINLDNEEELFNRVNKEKFKKREPENSVEIEEKIVKEEKEREEKEKIHQFIMENEKKYEESEQNEEFFRTTYTKPKGKHF